MFLLLPLLFGGAIYCLWRPLNPVFYRWILNIFGLHTNPDLLNDYIFFNHNIPDWIVYSLPGGLWAFSYTFFITIIWTQSKLLIKYFWFLTVPVIIIGSEVLQYPEIIKGTFSFVDLLILTAGMLFGHITGLLIIQLNMKRDKNITDLKNFKHPDFSKYLDLKH